MRFAHYSECLTKEAKFKDWRSKVGIRFDGTLRVTLKGKDMIALRNSVFERDGYRCVDEDPQYSRGTRCEGPLELSHRPPRGKSGGSDTLEGCKVRCRRHHRLLDSNQVKWGPNQDVKMVKTALRGNCSALTGIGASFKDWK